MKKLSIYSYVGYAFVVFALLIWFNISYDNYVLGMLIFGTILLLRDLYFYYVKKEV